MPNNSESIVALAPFAVRPKEAARLAGCCLAVLYERLNQGTYESFVDGRRRLVTVESIRRHQQKLAEVQGTPKTNPARPMKAGPGRPKKIDT
jgi:hypothetical protein